ncbi:hypothetical protein PFLmoz3_02493 [Pseudomonas fluorescens]|uniref:Uncharacterized protein n=1 Tax=Pseudomonas fluorescens TaxID=294 RepID=A0A109LHY7_PSEFL|nr:hypothetical protein PFLmoz3_02493 [Pseudomonas fluorescens]
MQGVGGTAFVAEFAVVIVFDDDRAERNGAVQQGFAPRLAHGHAEGELVGRRHIDQTGAIRDLVDLQALFVDGNTGDAGAHRDEQLACGAVAGVFHRDQAAGFKHHAGKQVQRLLCPVGDYDIAGAAFDPTGKRDMPGDGFAQGGHAFWLAVKATVLGDATQRILGATPPFILGELVACRRATDKFVAQDLLAGGVAHG